VNVIFRTLGYCDGYDVRVSGVRVNHKVVLLHFLPRKICLLLLFMLRRGSYGRWKRIIHFQVPVVNTRGYPIAFDRSRKYFLRARSEEFEIEDILPTSYSVFIHKFVPAYIEHRTYLLRDAEKGSGVDCQNV